MIGLVFTSLRRSKCVRSLLPIFCCSICIRHLIWNTLFGIAILLVLMFFGISMLLYNNNLYRHTAMSRTFRPSEKILHRHFGGLFKRKKGRDQGTGVRSNVFKIESLMQKNATPVHVNFQQKSNERRSQRSISLIQLSAPKSPQESFHYEKDNSISQKFKEFINANFNVSHSSSMTLRKISNYIKYQPFAASSQTSKNFSNFSTSYESIFSESQGLIPGVAKRKSSTFPKVLFVRLKKKQRFASNTKINKTSPRNLTSDFAIDPRQVKEEILPLYLQEYLNRKLQQETLIAAIETESLKKNLSEDIFSKESERPKQVQLKEILFKSLDSSNDKIRNQNSSMRLRICPQNPTTLEGQLDTNLTRLELLTVNEVIGENWMVLPGGFWTPWRSHKNPCLPRHKIAVIIPYRDRLEHLLIFISRLHHLLRNQQLEYSLFVVEQHGNITFNKGALMNAGFMEAWKRVDASCFIFHDVDLLPEDDRNMYSCPSQPRHLSVAVDTFNYTLPYQNLVGGVLNMKGETFFAVNGYSNLFWGWGGEDDDMSIRIKRSRRTITRPPQNIARYTMIKHKKRHSMELKVLQKLIRTSGSRFRYEGLNTQKYEVISAAICPLFTHFIIDVGLPPSILFNSMQDL